MRRPSTRRPARLAQKALLDSMLALLGALAGIVMFLPPLLPATTASVPRSIGAAFLIALAVPLHWVYLGIAARRMHRRVVGWVGLSVLLFPVGSAAALLVLGGLLARHDADPHAAPAH